MQTINPAIYSEAALLTEGLITPDELLADVAAMRGLPLHTPAVGSLRGTGTGGGHCAPRAGGSHDDDGAAAGRSWADANRRHPDIRRRAQSGAMSRLNKGRWWVRYWTRRRAETTAALLRAQLEASLSLALPLAA